MTRYLLALALLALSCVKPAPLENRSCPCLDEAGFFCCRDLCLRFGEVCPSPTAAGDGPADVPAPSDRASEASTPDGPAVDAREAPPDSRPPAPMDAVPDATPRPDTLVCGLGNQPCCPGNVCASGGCCIQNRCVAVGEACGPRSDLSCFNGSCGGDCGGLGESCCPLRTCTAPWTACDGEGAAAMCRSCGFLGEPCCDGVCDPGTGTVCTVQPDGGASVCSRSSTDAGLDGAAP